MAHIIYPAIIAALLYLGYRNKVIRAELERELAELRQVIDI